MLDVGELAKRIAVFSERVKTQNALKGKGR